MCSGAQPLDLNLDSHSQYPCNLWVTFFKLSFGFLICKLSVTVVLDWLLW